MSLIRRFKQNLWRLSGARPAQLDQPQRNAYSLSLPNPLGGAPLCRATLAWTATRHARGETVRLQAHLDGGLRASSERRDPALADARRNRRGMAALGRSAARGLARRGLAQLPLSRRRMRTWIDVQASTAPLATGAEALIPERLRELCGGGLPRTRAGEPRIGVWLGPAGGPASAQLALLQIDREDLPEDYRGRPFSLAASVATLTEPASDGKPDE